jgi:hypothetical protein
VPRSIQREWQYIDLFPDWSSGFRQLVSTIRQSIHRKPALPTV